MHISCPMKKRTKNSPSTLLLKAKIVKEATLLVGKVASIIDEMKERRDRIHLWMANFLRLSAANLSLTQAVTAGSHVVSPVFIKKLGKELYRLNDLNCRNDSSYDLNYSLHGIVKTVGIF